MMFSYMFLIRFLKAVVLRPAEDGSGGVPVVTGRVELPYGNSSSTGEVAVYLCSPMSL